MAEKATKASIRASFQKELGVDIGEKMARSIDAALESMKTEWFACDHCHKKTALVLPNAFERAKACQMVMEQIEGKVGTHREAPAVQKSVTGDLSELTDEQLVALLGGETTDDPPEDEDAD